MEQRDIRQERIAHLICCLLERDEYVKIEELADEMFVSRMTLDRLIPVIRQRMETFGVQLVTRPKFGIKAVGSEQDFRRLFLRYGFSKQLKELPELNRKILDTIVQNGLRITDFNLKNLTAHIALMVHRLQQSKPIIHIPKQDVVPHFPRETAARDEICSFLEERCHIAIPEADRTFLLIHLMVKCAADDRNRIQPNMLNLVDEILEDIYQHMHIDFRQDKELRTALALHLHPLLYRLMYDLLQQNPILSMVRREMGAAFEIAQHAAQVIYEVYGQHISEDETAYIALHFSVALDRLQYGRRIVLVQSGIRGADALLQTKIQNNCGYIKEEFVLCTSWELEQLSWDRVDCIVTFTPQKGPWPVPVVVYSPEQEHNTLDEIRKIRNKNERFERRGVLTVEQDLVFTDQLFASKEQVLTFLCGKIEEKYGIDIIAQVLKREMLASTELGNGLSVPHPYVYKSERPILAAMTLKKDILWKYDHVRMILLVAVPVGEDHFDFIGNLVGDLATDGKMMKQLLRSFDANHLNKLIADYRCKFPD